MIIISGNTFSKDLKWNCGSLDLRFNEIPGKSGKEFKVDGCWQDETYFIISADCKENLKACFKKGENNEIQHPGGKLGAPDFVLCYRLGGKPRFLEVKINNKWEYTSSCFFKSQYSFIDGETLMKEKKDLLKNPKVEIPVKK